MEKDPSKMTMREHAEAWWEEQGNTIPFYCSPEWNKMYAKWFDFVFPTEAVKKGQR